MLGINLLLAFAWLVLTGEFTPANFIAGLLIAYAILWVSDKATPDNSDMSRYLRRVRRITFLIFYVLWTVFIANFRMARAVLSPLNRLNPAIVAVPLDITGDIEITLLANWITLTPGTLTLEVSEDKHTMFVHTYHCTDVKAFRAEIKNDFERRIKELST